MQAATPCAVSVSRRHGEKASIYKCNRITLAPWDALQVRLWRCAGVGNLL